jgi:radical SAM protein with 4Fe4S-binding SPASM domain
MNHFLNEVEIMSKRVMIAQGAVLKLLPRFLAQPKVALRIAELQIEKWLFNWIHPSFREGRAHGIRQLSFRITDLCNLRCSTCGQWGEGGYLHGKSLKELRRQEVDPSRYHELLEDLVQHGHRPLVYIWGGEPMLYEGTVELIEKATSLGLGTSIVSNGSFIAPVAQRLVEAPLFLLQISIDGHCADLHNAVRPAAGGNGNSFAGIETTLAAVNEERRRQRARLPLIASLTVISQANHRHLVDIYEAFRDRVDLFVFYLSWWVDSSSAAAHDDDFERRFGFKPHLHRGWMGSWKPDDYAALQRQIDTLKERSGVGSSPPVIFIPDISGVEDLQTYYTDHTSRFGYDQCISIYQAVEVDSNGDMSPCRDYHDYVVGNVKEATITELWNAPAYRRFRQSLSRDGIMPVCTRCCGLMGY